MFSEVNELHLFSMVNELNKTFLVRLTKTLPINSKNKKIMCM